MDELIKALNTLMESVAIGCRDGNIDLDCAENDLIPLIKDALTFPAKPVQHGETADEIERLQAELDAAKRDISVMLQDSGRCDMCAHFKTKDCDAMDNTYCNAKWRGLCAENWGKDA